MPARPIRLNDPYITMGGPTVPPAVELTCFAKGIHLMGESDDALATFCDPLGYSWKLTIDFLLSFGLDSLDEALSSLGPAGTVVPFEFAYTPALASVDNPHWTGTVRLAAYPIVDAGINEPTEFEMEMDVIGDIVKDDGAITTVINATPSHAEPVSV